MRRRTLAYAGTRYRLIGEVAPDARESELIGLHSTIQGFGVLGPVVVGIAASAVGYEIAFVVVSLSALTGAGIVTVALVENFDSDVTIVAGDD